MNVINIYKPYLTLSDYSLIKTVVAKQVFNGLQWHFVRWHWHMQNCIKACTPVCVNSSEKEERLEYVNLFKSSFNIGKQQSSFFWGGVKILVKLRKFKMHVNPWRKNNKLSKKDEILFSKLWTKITNTAISERQLSNLLPSLRWPHHPNTGQWQKGPKCIF